MKSLNLTYRWWKLKIYLGWIEIDIDVTGKKLIIRVC